jgi:radical SAM protein (TIGR01212 family)
MMTGGSLVPFFRFFVMQSAEGRPSWFAPGRRYYPLSHFLRERFGGKVWRVTVDAGFTCPNVDGAVAVGGCVYCDNRSFSPNRRLPRIGIRAQVERGVRILEKYYGADRFVVYFQAATNTYAPVEKLRRLFDEALDHPQIVGLVIGTRPDSVADDVLDLVQSYTSGRYVSLELGLQTIHDRSLQWMNRGHGVEAFVDAVNRCRGRGFEVGTHVILGLPGESPEDMLDMARFLSTLPVDAVKIHNLHVVRDTPMEKMYQAGEVRMLELAEYVSVVCDFLEWLPPTMVIQRLSGDAPPEFLVEPRWCLDKPALLSAIKQELQRRDSWQSRRFVPGPHPSEAAPVKTGATSLPLLRAN